MEAPAEQDDPQTRLWRRAYEIFDLALEQPAEQREAFVSRHAAAEDAVVPVVLNLIRNAAADHLDAVTGDQPELQIGSRIGRYEITRHLGSGGKGHVYAARDTELGRTVALKLVAAASSETLLQEALAATALNHPNIVTVHDVVRQGSQTAIAMEFVEGRSLREYRGAPQPSGDVIRWGRQIARALGAGHARGIVHHNIKPENVIVRPDGYVKVLDFGLERRERPPDRYCSPEQERGEAATPASDIFSLGSVLYELLYGRRPIESQPSVDIAGATGQNERRPPADMQRESGVALCELLAEMTAQAPSLRPRAQEVEYRLAALISSSSAGSGPSRFRIRRKQRPPGWILLAGAAATIAVAMLVFFWPRPRTPIPVDANVIRYTIPMPAGIRVSSVTIAPKGDQIAYFAGGDEGNHVYRRYLDSKTSLPLAGSEFAAEPFFSPAGEIAFFTAGKIRIASDSGYRDIDTGMVAERIHADWSSDGWIYFDGVRDKETSIFRVRSEGGRPELVLNSLETPKGVVQRTCRQSFPDGLLFSTLFGSDQSSIGWLDARDRSTRTLLDHAMGGQILPTGHLLYYWNGDLLAAPFDLRRHKVTGSPVDVVKGVNVARFGFAGNASVSNNGTLVYLRLPELPRRRMVWVASDGSETACDLPPASYEQIEISPDGRTLAFVQQTERGRWSLSLFNFQNKIVKTLYEGKSPYMRAIWSPDSTRLVVSMIPDGQEFSNLFVIPIDSPEKVQQLTHQPLYNQFPSSWSGPANAILFTEGEHSRTEYDTMLLPLDTRQPKPMVSTPGVESGPSFSPDGRWFTYAAGGRVWLQDSAQSRPPRLVAGQGARNTLWSPSGNRIYYLERNVALMQIEVDQADNTGSPRQVLTTDLPTFPDTTSRGYTVGRDGKVLMLRSVPNQSPPGSEIEIVVNWFNELKRLAPAD